MDDCNNNNNNLVKFKCEMCEVKLRSKNGLDFHLLARHGIEKRFECNECDFATFKKRYLLSHKLKFHALECDACRFKTHSMGRLKRHNWDIHCLEEPFKCLYCDFRSAAKKIIDKHKCIQKLNKLLQLELELEKDDD